jgi:flagellar biosynthesis protein FlhB
MAEESFQERTEPASDKKRQDARSKGKVPRSVELNSALVILTGLMILSIFGAALVSRLAAMTASFFMRSGSMVINVESIQRIAGESMLDIASIVGPIVLGVMLAGLASSFAQSGFVFSTEQLRPTGDKLNPLNGIQRIMISRRSMVELAKTLLKVIIVGLVAYAALQDAILAAPTLVEGSVSDLLHFLGKSAGSIVLKTGMAYLALAVIDALYQRVEFERDLRMSKEEVKEETKSLEGDPLVKGRIRTIQRRMAYRRMMADVPKADVVVTNPTHLAIAIRYDAEEMTAPTVVAKGADHVARKIREIALENNIPIIEDKPLAQTLYRLVDVGEEIPEKMFQAVAQLLAHIYRLKSRQPSLMMN